MKRLITALVCILLALSPLAASNGITFIDGPYGKLAVRVSLPKGVDPQAGKCPTVILMHGVMAHMNVAPLPAIERALLAKGYACVRFDFNAQGKSEGDLLENTVPGEIEDAAVVYEYVRSLPFAGRIILMGHSQGGVVAAMLAGRLEEKGERVSSLVLLSPGYSIRRYAREGTFLGVRCDPEDPPEYVQVLWYRFGRKYIKTAQELPIEEESAKYTGPVCIVQGTKDNIVPKEDVDAYVPVFRNRVYITVDGADHVYSWHLGDVLSSVFIFLLAVGNSI